MVQTVTAPSHGILPAPVTRAYGMLLFLLLAAHAGVAIWAIAHTHETPWYYFRFEGYVRVALGSLAAFGAAFAFAGAYTRAIAWNGAILAASALLTPAVSLLVAATLLNAYVVGERVLRGRAFARSPGSHATISILVGVSFWIGVVSIAAPLRVHFSYVYATALIAPLLVYWRSTAKALQFAGRQLVTPGGDVGVTERCWIAILMTVVVLHLFLVAKPEAGYDAMAMHLQLAKLMAHGHSWPFDVSRYVWAVMPLGADWAFTGAYILGGEGAARLLNFCFAAILGAVMYQIIRMKGRREIALASVCMFASVPLAYLETSTLHVESLWTAFLLGTLLLALDGTRDEPASTWSALMLLAAGALQCKVIGVIWVVPLLAYAAYRVWRQRLYRQWTAREYVVMAVAVTFAVWPYGNAWMRTGNPVFPFMNALFQSPLFDSATSFNNVLYNAPVRPWSLYEMLWSSGRFIEGFNGAAGFHWLLLYPLIALAYVRWRAPAQWFALALAAIFFVGVYSQQSYLRYLFPFFALIAVIGGWAISGIPDGRATRVVILLVGFVFCAVHLRFIYTANWSNLTLCTGCAFDDAARRDYMAKYAPDRLAVEYLDSALPAARVGFFNLGGSPAGFVGYSRAGNWHDQETFWALANAESAGDVIALAKKFRLTHIVYRDPPHEAENRAMFDFRSRYTEPLWRANGIVVARIEHLPE
jgi:hypothetical protein